MTFSEHWRALVLRNPHLSQDENSMRMSVGEFRRLMEKCYASGHEAGVETAPDDSVFGRIFGNTMRGVKP